jgi:leucyl-tRNA synthetase
MHKKFDSEAIEKKWQQIWKEEGIYDVGERDNSKEKEYVLVEWPYPSGNLHIGHWYAFAVPDIYVRYKRMMGKQVLFPMGFDAFGLPAENAAIKRNLNPKNWTNDNIAFMKDQLASMGNSFAWDKTTSSTDPEYYKWTQWMFTQFFENDITYRGKGIVNWCPGCNTVIANEQVLADDTCERCGSAIEKKEMPQWMMRITKYADRLIDDLEPLNWPEHIKEAQRQWIGRSKGAEIDFKLSTGDSVTVFTTRPDTLFGATYLVLAPEHPLVAKNSATISNYKEVSEYVATAKQKDEQDRLDATKEKTGVKLEGVTATNPANGESVPVYVADYVLGGYGTGAIMAVPAHDERDNEFAKKFGIKIKQVVAKKNVFDGISAPRPELETLVRDCVDLIIEHPTDGTFLIQKEVDGNHTHIHFVGGGSEGESHKIALGRELEEETGFTNYQIVGDVIITSQGHGYRHTKNKNQLTTSSFYHVKLTSLEQKPSEIEQGLHEVEWVTREEVVKRLNWTGHIDGWLAFQGEYLHTGNGILINSGEFDGLDSEEAKAAIVEKVGGRMTSTYRLRDWSIGRQRYWGVPIPIVYDPEGKAHPVPKEHLPWTLPEDVDFKPTGVAPLSKSEELKKRTEEIFGKGWAPEVETMDTFVDSSWYFLRYIDNHNDDELSSLKAQKDWMSVDLYFGGAEHTTMHLLYSRFWQKALLDLGLVTESEPYKKRVNRGLILGPDGNKMSKSKGNVIDPDEQVKRVGADTVKMYLAFMGPYEGANYPFDLGGIAGVRRFLERVNGLTEHIKEDIVATTQKQLHKTIKKVGEDIATFKFNTAISTMMVFVNLVEKEGIARNDYETFLKILAPFAPHLTAELWAEAGKDSSIHLTNFPVADEKLTLDETVTIGVQINGKMRGTIDIARETTEDMALEAVNENSDLKSRIEGKEITKVVYVPGRILNLIIKE